jgi:CCR4-NOT transcription complex subunit 1
VCVQAFTVFVQQMNMHGLLKTDDLITRFFRMSTQMCVDLCYRQEVSSIALLSTR